MKYVKKPVVIAFCFLVIFLAACTDTESVKKYAEIEGWENYEITGYRLAACSQGDFYQTAFKAQKNGKTFTGTICKGLFFKGATLRLD